MGTSYLDIKSVTGGDERMVKQDLKFRTGNFVWKVVFNIPLNPATVNDQNLIVYNSQNKPIETHVSYLPDSNTIALTPVQAYVQGEVYRLKVSNRVESKGGQHLKNDISLEFSI